MAGQAVSFLWYGPFRIDSPQIQVQNGIATALSVDAGTIDLAFDGVVRTLKIQFQDPAATFAVVPDGAGYRVANPTPDLFAFSDVQIGGSNGRYAYLLKLAALSPTGVECFGMSATIGGNVLPDGDSLSVHIGKDDFSGVGYRISPRSGASQLLLVPSDNFGSWQAACFLDFRSDNASLWCLADGIIYTPPPQANADFRIAGTAGSGIQLSMGATEQPADVNCGEIVINQLDNIGSPEESDRQPLLMYGIEMTVAPNGLFVEAVHWALYDPSQSTKISPVPTLEDIPSAFYPNRFRGEPFVSLRALVAHIWMQIDETATWSSGVEFGGEVRPRFLYDRSNAGIRLFSPAIKCDEIDNFRLLFSGSASARRKPISALLRAYTTTIDPPEDEGGIRGLAFGDVTLVIGQSPNIWPVDELLVAFRSDAGPGEQWSGWRFPIAQIRKSPLKGDAVGVVTGEPDGLDPRTEVYQPTTPGPVMVPFSWADQQPASDLFTGFSAANAAVGTLQPENSQIQFTDGTKATYSFAAHQLSSGYTQIDATMIFPPIPADAASRLSGTGSSPTVRWKEDFHGQVKADQALRRVWDSGLTQNGSYSSDYQSFLTNNTSMSVSRASVSGKLQMSLPYGWSVAFSASPAERVIAIFQAIKNEAGGQRALQERNQGATRQFQILTAASEVEGPLPDSYWFPATSTPDVDRQLDLAFPSTQAAQRASQVVSPLDQNWAGFATARGSVVPPPGLPQSLSALIAQLQYDYVGWDGQGVTAVCVFKGQKGDDQLQLTGFTLVIHRSQIQTLLIEFSWCLPFFSFTSDVWLPFMGRFEKSGNGGSIVFKSGAIGAEFSVFDALVDIVFSDIELVTGTGSSTTIRINATMRFATSQTMATFNGPIPAVSFRNMAFDFDNPFNSWSMPDLKLDTEVTLYPFGFRYQLYGLYFHSNIKHDKTNRILTFNGGLQYATPSPGFGSNPNFLLNMQLTVTPGAIDFDLKVDGIDGISFDLFDFFTVAFSNAQLTNKVIGADISVASKWSDATPFTAKGAFLFGDTTWSRDKFWYLGFSYVENDRGFKLGPVGAKDFGILIGHNVTFDGLRETLISGDIARLESLLDSPHTWQYSGEFPWFAALWFKNLDIGLPTAFLSGGPGAFVLSDSGLFRALVPLKMMGINFTNLDLGIDWRNREVAASLTLMNLTFGPYEMDAGTVSALFSPTNLMVSWGYPFDNDWGRAVKLRWEPPIVIPINAVDGGVMFEVGKGGVNTGVALRVGYQETIGADGGMFGAYVRGEIMIGGTVTTGVLTGSETVLVHTGTIDLHIEAAGGLVIAGIRWDVLRVWLDTGVQFTLVIGSKMAHAYYGAWFTAGYDVCPTPCTCVGGSVSFHYSMDAPYQTNYQWPPSSSIATDVADGLLREQRTGDALIELLRRDFR